MDTANKLILARDMIGMIRKYSEDANVLEYLESFCSSLGSILGQDDVVNWWDLAGVCDQRYYSLKQGKPVPLNTDILDKWSSVIESQLNTNNK